VPRPIFGRNTLWSSPSSCFSCSPPKVSCAAAPVTLGWRSAAPTLPPGPSAFARYGPNCSHALPDRPLVPDINAKGGVESGGAEDLKIAIFTLHIRPMASSEQASGGQWVMTRGKSGLAGAPGRAGGVTILGRVFAVDPLQKQRQVIADTIHDCNRTRCLDRFFATALAAWTRWWNKAGTCGSAPLRCCGT
jgi:hypothetical protein